MDSNQVKYTENIFSDIDYVHYMVQYEGNYDGDINIPDGYITIIDDNYAILSLKSFELGGLMDAKRAVDEINNQKADFNIIYIQPPEVYALQNISAIDAAGVNILQAQLPLDLSGKGVVIGIIDTGIDYLSKEFMDSQGNTRINTIWDQTIETVNDGIRKIPFGQIYLKNEIQEAINAKANGKNPYDIVPSIDKNGHGTSMAGVVGARGQNPDIRGIAPECEFVVVKLLEDVNFKYRNNYSDNINVYGAPMIFSAIEFLKQYLINTKKPTVILLPLGTNTGNHKGDNILDDYIETITNNIGIAVVSGTGNEGINDGHVSGIIQNKDDQEVIEMIVDEGQKDFYIEIWADLPNVIEVNLISPSGQSTGTIQVSLGTDNSYSFILEKTRAFVFYYVPERFTGDELIRIYFYDISPGVWSIGLNLRLGELARYNAWMMQKEFISPGTRFSPSDPYGTVTIPGDSTFVITVAAYNQNNNNLLAYSGTAFKDDRTDKIDFAAGGVNTMTVGLNNTVAIINGTSLSAAIGAGACVLLFQWGIVNGNYPYMYTQSIKTFLQRGTIQRRGEAYPNPHLGYGIINFYKIFEKII